MTVFTAWKFDDPDGAKQAYEVLRDAQRDQLVDLVDHAVVSWPAGSAVPETDLSHDGTVRTRFWGGVLGVLVGMLFFMPANRGLTRAVNGATAKAMEGTGITINDIELLREQVTPGTSALFAVTDDEDVDRLGERFHGMSWRLVTTNLTDAERGVLAETFGG